MSNEENLKKLRMLCYEYDKVITLIETNPTATVRLNMTRSRIHERILQLTTLTRTELAPLTDNFNWENSEKFCKKIYDLMQKLNKEFSQK